jgi:hypothetical protein
LEVAKPFIEKGRQALRKASVRMWAALKVTLSQIGKHKVRKLIGEAAGKPGGLSCPAEIIDEMKRCVN